MRLSSRLSSAGSRIGTRVRCGAWGRPHIPSAKTPDRWLREAAAPPRASAGLHDGADGCRASKSSASLLVGCARARREHSPTQPNERRWQQNRKPQRDRLHDNGNGAKMNRSGVPDRVWIWTCASSACEALDLNSIGIRPERIDNAEPHLRERSHGALRLRSHGAIGENPVPSRGNTARCPSLARWLPHGGTDRRARLWCVCRAPFAVNRQAWAQPECQLHDMTPYSSPMRSRELP